MSIINMTGYHNEINQIQCEKPTQILGRVQLNLQSYCGCGYISPIENRQPADAPRGQTYTKVRVNMTVTSTNVTHLLVEKECLDNHRKKRPSEPEFKAFNSRVSLLKHDQEKSFADSIHSNSSVNKHRVDGVSRECCPPPPYLIDPIVLRDKEGNEEQ